MDQLSSSAPEIRLNNPLRPAIQRRRVVITGIGVVSPIGIGREQFSSALKSGVVGVERISHFDPTGLPSTIGAIVRDFAPTDFMPAKEVRKLGRAAHLAVAAAQLANKDAGLQLTEEEKFHCPVFIGTAVGGMDFAEEQYAKCYPDALDKVSPYAGVAVYCASISSAISASLALHGRSVSMSDGCCSGTDAIAEAMEHIRWGDGDVAYCGGADACVVRGVLAAFCKMGIVSEHHNTTPKTACKPFHRKRDGIVLGEGAWVMVVESYERAVDRDATIYAELAGYGSSCDAFHPSRPHPDGTYTIKAIYQALADAGKASSEIDYVSAYGNGTLINDPLETAIYKKAFGERAYRIAFSSIKSMIGHPIGATGAAQVVASALAIHEGFIPPTMNLDEPDPLCDLDYVPNVCRKQDLNSVLVNTLSFGGKNACLVLRKP